MSSIKTRRSGLDFFDAPNEIEPLPLAFVPTIIREAATVGNIVKGLITIAGAGTLAHPRPVEDMIGGRSRVRVKEREDENDDDNKHVVKVADACFCVEQKLNSERFTAFVMQCFIKTLIEGDVGLPLQEILDEIVDCIRSKELRQNKPFHRETRLGYSRKIIIGPKRAARS